MSVDISDQQLLPACGYRHRDLQAALASGVVLQVDQAAPAHQGLLRNQRERRESANLDRRFGLRSGCHCAQTARAGGQSLPNPTGAQSYSVRENPHSTGTSEHRLPRQITMLRQSNESVQLIAGQQ